MPVRRILVMNTLAFILLGGLNLTSVHAQTSLGVGERVQYLQALSGAAQAALDTSDINEAKRLIIAGIPLVQLLTKNAQMPPVAQALNQYQAVHNSAWKDAPPTTQAELESLMSFLKKHSYELSQMRKNFESTPQSWPQGTNQFRRFISNMLAGQKKVSERCKEFAAKVPPPLILYQQQNLYQTLYNDLYKPIYDVAIGPSLAAAFAKEKVVPETLKSLEAQLKRSKADTLPESIYATVWKMDEALRDLSNIDGALRSEKAGIDGLEAQLTKLKEEVKAETARANKLLDERIKANRMPKEIWQGGPRSSVVGSIKRAYRNAYPKDKIMRVSVQSIRPENQWEIFRRGEGFVAQYAMYVKAAVAVAQPSGKHRVFFAWYKRVRTPDRAWTGWQYNAPVGSYLILPENISK